MSTRWRQARVGHGRVGGDRRRARRRVRGTGRHRRHLRAPRRPARRRARARARRTRRSRGRGRSTSPTSTRCEGFAARGVVASSAASTCSSTTPASRSANRVRPDARGRRRGHAHQLLLARAPHAGAAARRSPSERGRIVNVSSVAARLSPPAEAAYAATKAAISAWAGVHAGRPARHRRRAPRRVPRRHRHRAVPPPRQRPAPRHRRRGVARRRDRRARAADDRARTFEVAVPDWFNGVFSGKYNDVAAFLDGTIACLRIPALRPPHPEPASPRGANTHAKLTPVRMSHARGSMPAHARRRRRTRRIGGTAATASSPAACAELRPHRDQIRRAGSRRRWVLLYDGVYRAAGAPATWRGDLLAASLAAPTDACRDLAPRRGSLYALPGGRDDLVELTLPAVATHANAAASSCTRAVASTQRDIQLIDGIPVTTPERTILELASCYRTSRLPRVRRCTQPAASGSSPTSRCARRSTASPARPQGRRGTARSCSSAGTRDLARPRARWRRCCSMRSDGTGFPNPSLQYEVRDATATFRRPRRCRVPAVPASRSSTTASKNTPTSSNSPGMPAAIVRFRFAPIGRSSARATTDLRRGGAELCADIRIAAPPSRTGVTSRRICPRSDAGSGEGQAGRPTVLVSRYSSKPAMPCSRPWPLSL